MPIYLLNRNELVEASMPGVLTDFIAFDHWQTICRMLKDSEIQAHSWVFLCIKNNTVRKLNRTLFDNNQVLSFVNGGLSINTDLIPAGLHPVTMVMVQSAYSPMAQVTVIDSGYQAPGVIVVSTQPSQPTGQVVSVSAAVPVGAPITVQPVAEPVGMQSMAIEQRSMRWNLPSSIHVGQVLTIVDPDGRPMKFTVEAHHKPGEEIILPY